VGQNICILTGELSGDAYGAMLAKELLRKAPDLDVWGIGSWRMHEAKVRLLAESSRWAAIGVVQSLRVAPRLAFGVLPRLRREIRRRAPALLIPIDFGAFNVPVCRWAKQHGVPVLYYLPPGSWRREGPLPTRIAEVTDAVATQFPWSAERLRRAGARAYFVGHPLLDLIGPQPSRKEFLQTLSLPSDTELVALLPGSRPAELSANSPALAHAAIQIHAARPQTRFVIAIAHQSSVERIGRAMRRLLSLRDSVGQPVAQIVWGKTHAVMAHASVGIVCSGTATLEAAILGMPMVIIYRGTPLMYVEYLLRRMSRLRWIGLPNIIAGEDIVPELVAEAATAHNMAHHALELLSDQQKRARMKNALGALRAELGEPGATRRTADLALEMLGYPPTGKSQV